MPSTQWLIKQIKNDYRDIDFVHGSRYSWLHSEHTITYSDDSSDWPMVLHELAHALLNHQNYKHSIDLIKIERDAWTKAESLASSYGLTIDKNYIEDSLDSYRDWLYKRSECPRCTSVGIELDNQSFTCLSCNHQWKTNDGRSKRLKRDPIKK